MKMQRLNLILILVVAVLGLGIFLLPDEDQMTETGTPITPLAFAAINSITVQRKDKTDQLHFVKQDGQWRIPDQPQLDLNHTRINNMLALTQAKAKKQFAAEPDKLGKYGLSEPRFVVTVNDMVLAFGHADPLHQKRYIKQGDNIFLIDDRYSHLLADPAIAYVSASLLPSNSKPVKLQLPDFTLEKGTQDWQLAPQPAIAVSQDDLLGVVEEWRYASAMRVKVLDKNLPGKGKPITIELENQPQALQFNAFKTEDEWILQRPELGIQYHFTPSAADNLLNYQPPPAAE